MSIIPESAFTNLAILNVGAGDLRINFDKDDPADADRAKTMIGDMLKRGYAIFVEVDGKLEPVEAFDAEKFEYVIGEVKGLKTKNKPGPKPNVPKGRGKRTVNAKTSKATAVPRSGGG